MTNDRVRRHLFDGVDFQPKALPQIPVETQLMVNGQKKLMFGTSDGYFNIAGVVNPANADIPVYDALTKSWVGVESAEIKFSSGTFFTNDWLSGPDYDTLTITHNLDTQALEVVVWDKTQVVPSITTVDTDTPDVNTVILKIASGTGFNGVFLISEITSGAGVLLNGLGQQASGSSGILVGSGVPSDSLGSDGFIYINSLSGDLYSKNTGVWTKQSNLMGPMGPVGSTGPQGVSGIRGLPGSQIYTGVGAPQETMGVNGDFYFDIAVGEYYSKSNGTWSLQGSFKGTDGAAGTSGSSGSKIYTGQGAPLDGFGSDADQYLDIADGDWYSNSGGIWTLQTTFVLSVNGQTGMVNLTASEVGAVPTSAVGASGGVASLDASGRIPSSQLPGSVSGGLIYQGTWDGSTGLPSLPPADPANKGYYYKVSVSGNFLLDGCSEWTVGDSVVSDGIAWERLVNTDSVVSVAGKTGAVQLNVDDIVDAVSKTASFSGDVSGTQLSGLTVTGIRGHSVAPLGTVPVRSVLQYTPATRVLNWFDINALPINWSALLNVPTTVAGYGITDGATTFSPIFTGIPQAPTAASGDNSAQIATTAFVTQAVLDLGGFGNFVNITDDQEVGGRKTFLAPITFSSAGAIGPMWNTGFVPLPAQPVGNDHAYYTYLSQTPNFAANFSFDEAIGHGYFAVTTRKGSGGAEIKTWLNVFEVTATVPTSGQDYIIGFNFNVIPTISQTPTAPGHLTSKDYVDSTTYSRTVSDVKFSQKADKSYVDQQIADLQAGAVVWSKITQTPNNLAGYGILDAVAQNAQVGLGTNSPYFHTDVSGSYVGGMTVTGIYGVTIPTPPRFYTQTPDPYQPHYHNFMLKWVGTENTPLNGTFSWVNTDLDHNAMNWLALYNTPTTIAGYGLTDAAPKNSPTFTGIPQAPTPDTADTSTKIATTAFVKAAIQGGFGDPSLLHIDGDETILDRKRTNREFVFMGTAGWAFNVIYVEGVGYQYASNGCGFYTNYDPATGTLGIFAAGAGNLGNPTASNLAYSIAASGQVTFHQPVVGATPLDPTHLATKGYVDTHPVAWTTISGTPTSIEGYGIQNGITTTTNADLRYPYGNNISSPANSTFSDIYDSFATGLKVGGIHHKPIPAIPNPKGAGTVPNPYHGTWVLSTTYVNSTQGVQFTWIDFESYAWNQISGTPTNLNGYGVQLTADLEIGVGSDVRVTGLYGLPLPDPTASVEDVVLKYIKATGVFQWQRISNIGVNWSQIGSVPTTVAGYGITDAVSATASFGGDISGTFNSTFTVNRIQGIPVIAPTAAEDGKVLAYDDVSKTFHYVVPQMAGSFLDTSGGTLTGPLILAADPITNLGAATKIYVDNLVSPKATTAALTAHTNNHSNPHLVTAAQINAIPVTDIGVSNGVASLDATGKVPVSQIPAAAIGSALGAMVYQGTWNASNNTPTLTPGAGTKGAYYKVGVAGVSIIDGNSNWTVGDLIAFNGTTWDQIQGGTSDVASVAGKVGAVTLVVADVSGAAPLASPALTGNPTAPTPNVADNSTSIATTAFVKAASPVSSVNTLTGAVVLTTTNINEGANLYFSNARAIASTLTGFSATSGGAVAATDSILQALQKHEYRIANMVSTVSSVNTMTGAVVLTTANISEVTNLYFTNARGIGSVLTGLSTASGGTVAATDSILAAIGKLENRTALNDAKVSWPGSVAFSSVTGKPTTLAGYGITDAAPLASPALTGTPTAPTPVTTDNTTKVATTAFVAAYVSANSLSSVSPALTGTPTAPTATVGTNTTQLATTAFVTAGFAPIASPALTGTPTAPTATAGDNSTKIATTAFIAASYAPLASPAFSGTPTAPTPLSSDSSTKIATTAFVAANFPNAATVSSTYAPLASPNLTGVPHAPTPSTFDNSTTIATTAYVKNQAYLQMLGTWDAAANNPALPAASAANKGGYYKVTTAGTTLIDGVRIWNVGDMLVSNGTTWDKITNSVTSVAGKTGVVTLVAADIPDALADSDLATVGGYTSAGKVPQLDSAGLIPASMVPGASAGGAVSGDVITTSPSLAAGQAGNAITITLGRTMAIKTVLVAAGTARIRIYTNTTDLNADLTRPVTQNPSVGLGLVLDVTPTAGSEMALCPPPFWAQKTPTYYMLIENYGASAQAFTVTMNVVVMEA
jgi:hypothetical protein